LLLSVIGLLCINVALDNKFDEIKHECSMSLKESMYEKYMEENGIEYQQINLSEELDA